MKEIILILLTIIFLSCNSEKSHQKETTNNNDGSEVEIKTAEVENDTSFFDFFEKFMWDKEFQKSRVQFPFQQKGNTIKTSEDWEHLPFYTQSSYVPTLSSDTLSLININVKIEKTELYILDFEKNIANKFAFKKLNKNWQLLSLETTTFENVPDNEFINFLKKFSNDSIFQINHITFPLPGLFADSDNDYETVSRTIKLEYWKLWKLTDDINSLMLLSNIQTDNKYRNIFFRGVENGIWVKYTFEKINGNWKLIRLEDYST